MAEKIIIIPTRVCMDVFIKCEDNDVLLLGTIIDRGKMVVPVGYSSKICFENY